MLHTIYIRITADRQREEWSTQRRSKRDEWDVRSGRMAGTRAEARSVNDWLEALNARAHECRQQLFASGKPFTAIHVRKLMQGEEIEPPKMLSEIWDYQFNYIIGLLGKNYTKATLVKYRTSYKHLKKYLLSTSGNDDMRLDQLNYKFIREYDFHLRTNCNLKNNTAIQMVKRLRTVVRIAMDLGWLQRDPFLAHRMKTDEVHRNYLTGEELSRMAIKNLGSKRLAIVRDLFLFSCYTGLSFADTVKLGDSDVFSGEDGLPWLQTHRVKNNNRVHIPLLPPAIAIIDHYKSHPRTPAGKLLPEISNQRANSYLKEIAAKLHIDKHLTYHCARHTFATTVTLTNGVPIETVGQMLGHKNIRSTQHYARVTDTKVRVDMQPLLARYKGQPLYLMQDEQQLEKN